MCVRVETHIQVGRKLIRILFMTKIIVPDMWRSEMDLDLNLLFIIDTLNKNQVI